MTDDRSGLLTAAERLIDEYGLVHGDAEAFYSWNRRW